MEFEDSNSDSTIDHLLRLELPAEAERVLDQCSPVEAQVLRMSFGIGCEPCTLKEVGERVGLRRGDVSDIEVAVIQRLRGKMGE